MKLWILITCEKMLEISSSQVITFDLIEKFSQCLKLLWPILHKSTLIFTSTGHGIISEMLKVSFQKLNIKLMWELCLKVGMGS